MTRVIRTLIAVLVAVPTAVGTLVAAGVPVPPDWVALITGIAGAIVVLVTAAITAPKTRVSSRTVASDAGASGASPR